MATNDSTDLDAIALVLTVPETLALYRALQRTLRDRAHLDANRPGIRGAGSDRAGLNRIMRALDRVPQLRPLVIPPQRRARGIRVHI